MVPRMQKFGSSLLTRCSIGGVRLNGVRDALRSCHERRAAFQLIDPKCGPSPGHRSVCLLYTSDAADDM
eukprot:1483525-Prorocentrum_lima.AAC.1